MQKVDEKNIVLNQEKKSLICYSIQNCKFATKIHNDADINRIIRSECKKIWY